MFPIRDSVPSRSVPIATRMVILVNVIVFFFELMLPRGSLEQLVYRPGRRNRDNLLAHLKML